MRPSQLIENAHSSSEAPSPLPRIIAASGIFLAALSTVASHFWVMGALPPALFGRGQWLATLWQVHGVPVELLTVLGFVLLTLALHSALHPPDRAVAVFWVSTTVLGLGLALIFRNPRAIPLWGCALAALFVLLEVSISPAGHGVSVRQLPAQVVKLLRLSSVWAAVVICILSGLVVAQFMSFRVAAVPRNDAVRQELVRWFRSAKAVDSELLRGTQSARRVVVFTDYQCSFCRVTVPQFRAVVAGSIAEGTQVEMIVLDYPLNSACNPAAAATLHPLACDAAAAARLVRQQRPNDFQMFESWLYEQGPALTREKLIEKLTGLDLDGAFTASYEDLLAKVRADAVLGTNVGVVGTPTTFLDGVRLPTVSPMGLADLLAGTAPRWPAKPAAVNPMR